MASGPLKDQMIEEYHRNGFVVAKRMFNSEEIDLLRRAAKEDRELDQHSYGKGDGEGGTVRLSLWNHPGDTIYGMFARCESVVNSAEKILEGEVYHYHSKMIMKDAKVGRRLDLAPGLRLLVSEWRTVSSVVQCFHRGGRRHSGKRLFAGAQGVAQSRPHRSRSDGRPGRRRSRAGARGRETAGTCVSGNGSRRCGFLPRQSSAQIRSKPFG